MIRYESTPPVGVRWHPYADIFPWIEGAAFEDFKEDIRRNGVLEPIVFLDGMVLDGRNRYMAARHLGIPYPRTEYTGNDPLGFVISTNLKRRHLTESQRAMVATRLAKLEHGANQFQRGPANLPVLSEEGPIPAITQAQAAQMLNVSERSIRTARTVEEQGAPELIAGAVTAKSAAELVASSRPGGAGGPKSKRAAHSNFSPKTTKKPHSPF